MISGSPHHLCKFIMVSEGVYFYVLSCRLGKPTTLSLPKYWEYMLRLVNANSIQLVANDSFGLSTYDHATCILGKSLRNPSLALMSMVEFRGHAHSTTATAMVCSGILIEFVRLSGISVVCSWTSMITLQSSSIIFLEPCFVHMTPMQFRDAKSFPKIIGHVWLLQ